MSDLTCERPGCSNSATVGVGPWGFWVCNKHYQEYLKEKKQLLNKITNIMEDANGS